MTPMIDCVMLLLVFFMVTSKFKSTEADILSLAYARNANPEERAEEKARFVINVRFEEKGGSKIIFTVQGMVFDPESRQAMDRLGENLRGFRFQEPNGEIMVRVDRNVEYGSVKKLQKVMRDKLGVGKERELKVSYSVDPNPPGEISQ